MKSIKALFIAALLLLPSAAFAGGPRISFSLNFFDASFPVFVARRPAPVPVLVPCPPPAPIYIEREVIIRDYSHPYFYPRLPRPHHY